MTERVRVMVTCPPMLGAIDQYRPQFEERLVDLYCPDVVQTLTEGELIRLVPAFDGWIIGDDPATRAVLGAGKDGRLRAAINWGVGVDNIDQQAMTEFGIKFANTPGVFGGEVADIAVGYVIGLARRTYWIDRRIRGGEWPKPRGSSLAGKTVALVGFGDIGRHTARRLFAFDVRVVAYDPAFEDQQGLEAVERETWPARIGEVDYIVLTCALTENNRHMINEDTLQLVKPGVRVVNVSRGPLIDEAALAEALASGRVAAAALDVFEVEPLPEESPLRQYENCIFGSHNGSNTNEGVDRASQAAMERMFEFLGL